VCSYIGKRSGPKTPFYEPERGPLLRVIFSGSWREMASLFGAEALTPPDPPSRFRSRPSGGST
jgi:hypothetical protein